MDQRNRTRVQPNTQSHCRRPLDTMKWTVSILDPTGAGIPDAMRRSFEALPRRRGLRHVWRITMGAAILTAWDRDHATPATIEESGWIATGSARLDNRRDI